MRHDQALSVANTHRKTLERVPGVVGVGAGDKWTGGKKTGKTAVLVLVKKKVAKEQLEPGALIPETLEGMPTDVIEVGVLKAQDGGSLVLTPPPVLVDPSRQKHTRPVMPGISIGPTNYGIAGTIGAICFDKQGRALALSNAHVLYPTWWYDHRPVDQLEKWQIKVGNVARQPATGDGVYDPPYAEGDDDCGLLQGGYVPGVDGTDMDAATALLYANIPYSQTPKDLPQLTLGVKEAAPGVAVTKSGRTTAITKGTVIAIGVSIAIGYPFGDITMTDQVLFSGMSAPGDSGSVIVTADTYQPVALLFAGSDTVTVGTPLQRVLDFLGLTLERPVPQVIQQLRAAGLQDSQWSRVWGYEAATQSFRLFDPKAPLASDLQQLEAGKGYWLFATGAATLRGNALYPGWNNIGWTL